MVREGEVLEDAHRMAAQRSCVGGLGVRAMSSMTSRFGSGIGRLHRLHRRTKEALCLLICCCSEALGEDGV